MELTKKQTKALDILENDIINELVFGGGAGGAKTALGCYWTTKCALKYAGSRWVIGRANLKTLKETTLNTLFWLFQKQGLKPNIHYKYNDNKSIITFVNGSEILLKDLFFYPSDPNFDELGSLEITGFFVDEVNQIVYKAWQILKSRIRYKLDNYCHVCGDTNKQKIISKDKEGRITEWICANNHNTKGLIPKALGTCNPAKGWVYDNFYRPNKNGDIPKHRAFIQSLADDNPYISEHYRNNLLSLDKNAKERLLYGNWEYDDDPTVLCEYDAILDVFTNAHVKPTSQKYISADLAMQGRDKYIAGVWNGLVCDLTKGCDMPKATGKIIENTLKDMMVRNSVPHSRTVVDSDGMGAYLESYLTGIKEFHGNAKPQNAEYANKKSECAYKLAELINKREIYVICTEEQKTDIIQELEVLKSDGVDNDTGKKRIIKKEKMKDLLGRSPDYLDMLIMRMFFETKASEYLIYSEG